MFEIDCNRYRIEQSVKRWAVQKLKNIDITFIIQWVLCLFHSQSGHWGGNHWPHHDCYNNPLHPYHKNRLHPTSRAQSTSEREREILHFCLSHELSSSDYWLSGVRLHRIQVFVIEFAYAGDSHFLLNVGWHNHGLCSAEERVSILRPQADIRNLNLKVGDGRSNSNDSFGECQPLGLGPTGKKHIRITHIIQPHKCKHGKYEICPKWVMCFDWLITRQSHLLWASSADMICWR